MTESSVEALAKLAEIPPAGSEERERWLEEARRHAPGDALMDWFVSDAILALMSAARRQGQRDVLSVGSRNGALDRSRLREMIHRHGGEFFGPRVEHVSIEEQAFWRFLDEVIATAAALATGGARHG